jgi:deltex-like protein
MPRELAKQVFFNFRLLRTAFDRRLIFTIGKSTTTGRDNSLIWNGIHHKTEKEPNKGLHSFPDNKYFASVFAELKKMGVY